MAAAAVVYEYTSVVSSMTRVKSPGKPGFPCVFAGFTEHCAEFQFHKYHAMLPDPLVPQHGVDQSGVL